MYERDLRGRKKDRRHHKGLDWGTRGNCHLELIVVKVLRTGGQGSDFVSKRRSLTSSLTIERKYC